LLGAGRFFRRDQWVEAIHSLPESLPTAKLAATVVQTHLQAATLEAPLPLSTHESLLLHHDQPLKRHLRLDTQNSSLTAGINAKTAPVAPSVHDRERCLTGLIEGIEDQRLGRTDPRTDDAEHAAIRIDLRHRQRHEPFWPGLRLGLSRHFAN
jgi:hypothetical protein